MIGAIFFFPFHHLFTRLGFWLDDIFFPDYRLQPVKKPVFIIGNPRSGSTLLQRVIAKDVHNFTCMRTWEIYFAPSITQRKIFQFLARMDNLVGSPLQKVMGRWDKKILGQTTIHEMGLWEPEEDEGILLHIWGSYFFFVAFPIPELLPPYAFFDERIPIEEKNRIMEFYKKCVKKHLYYHGGDRVFLAKNPYFSGKIESILRFFPDARFIYMVRNPLEVLPSTMTWWSYLWHVTSDPLEKYPFSDLISKESQYRYSYPLKFLEKLPQNQYIILGYEDLIASVDRSVNDVYATFGMQMKDVFERLLQKESQMAQQYQSNNTYTLEETGFSRQQVLEDFADVFERFGFDTGEQEEERELIEA
jgi:hypothetical protein